MKLNTFVCMSTSNIHAWGSNLFLRAMIQTNRFHSLTIKIWTKLKQMKKLLFSSKYWFIPQQFTNYNLPIFISILPSSNNLQNTNYEEQFNSALLWMTSFSQLQHNCYLAQQLGLVTKGSQLWSSKVAVK